MIALLLFGYYLWVYVVVGYHGRTWYYWWQRECIVRYIPPISNSCCEISSPINNQTEINTPSDVENNTFNNNNGAVVIYVNSIANADSTNPNCSENDETCTIITKSDDTNVPNAHPFDPQEASTAFTEVQNLNSRESLESGDGRSDISTQNKT